MNFHWISFRIKQGQFKANWGPGKENLVDASTRHHPLYHHKKMRPINLYVEGKCPLTLTLKGCIEIMTKLPMTQMKRNTVTVTAALISPNRYTHKICTIVKQLNHKIQSSRSPI